MNPPDPQLTLVGNGIRLEPLRSAHLDGLNRSCSATALWQYMPALPPSSMSDWHEWLSRALAERDSGGSVPFALVQQQSEVVVGSTRYLDIAPQHGGIEIGWTFISPSFQRTGVNTEVKLLLLGHAFEALGAERVCIKTDRRNVRAQRAIERLGASYEGTLRRHRILPDGFVRDSVYYSILADEWPTVKNSLLSKSSCFSSPT